MASMMKMQGTRRATSSTARACWPSRTWGDAMEELMGFRTGSGGVQWSRGSPTQNPGAFSGFQPLPARLSRDRGPASIRHVRRFLLLLLRFASLRGLCRRTLTPRRQLSAVSSGSFRTTGPGARPRRRDGRTDRQAGVPRGRNSPSRASDTLVGSATKLRRRCLLIPDVRDVIRQRQGVWCRASHDSGSIKRVLCRRKRGKTATLVYSRFYYTFKTSLQVVFMVFYFSNV